MTKTTSTNTNNTEILYNYEKLRDIEQTINAETLLSTPGLVSGRLNPMIVRNRCVPQQE